MRQARWLPCPVQILAPPVTGWETATCFAPHCASIVPPVKWGTCTHLVGCDLMPSDAPQQRAHAGRDYCWRTRHRHRARGRCCCHRRLLQFSEAAEPGRAASCPPQ